jgi:pilus assembly protein Flp/PilA
VYTYLKLWLALKTDRRAVTALEYGLIAALIAGVIITAVTTIGSQMATMFGKIAADMTSANTAVK